MRIVVALGGNALLKRGEPMTYEAQRSNVRIAAVALADLAQDHQIIRSSWRMATGRRSGFWRCKRRPMRRRHCGRWMCWGQKPKG